MSYDSELLAKLLGRPDLKNVNVISCDFWSQFWIDDHFMCQFKKSNQNELWLWSTCQAACSSRLKECQCKRLRLLQPNYLFRSKFTIIFCVNSKNVTKMSYDSELLAKLLARPDLKDVNAKGWDFCSQFFCFNWLN